VKAVQRMLGHASAAMTLDVYSGLVDDDRLIWPTGWTPPRGRPRKLVWAPCGRRVGANPDRGPSEWQTFRSTRWAPRGSNPQPAD
jgi:hypothetical protein